MGENSVHLPFIQVSHRYCRCTLWVLHTPTGTANPHMHCGCASWYCRCASWLLHTLASAVLPHEYCTCFILGDHVIQLETFPISVQFVIGQIFVQVRKSFPLLRTQKKAEDVLEITKIITTVDVSGYVV